MAKGIIVVEMPENCVVCPLKSQLYDNQYICTLNHRRFAMFAQSKPDWCPIRPIPERKEVMGSGKYRTIDFINRGRQIGWNDCIDYICATEGRKGD